MSTSNILLKSYCNSLTGYSRLDTREVKVGDVPLGGKNPIRIQSMTTTDTMDTTGTVEQSIRMIKAGCEYVRITAPSIKEARNLEVIKKELKARGFNVPIIADIHFTPNAAELAARIVEKVRVNPGNYADKKKFQIFNYTDDLYRQELERIREKFTPLVRICKEYGTAMRIGTNHGSLSDRIMSRYGDTPTGMVESALEFLRICEDEGYYDIVLSMKASNPIVMIEAYRLLVSKMNEEGMNYPLHLGVTEAGDGEDGRIKSSVGIGTLLEDGLGDTIRVSLTEEPEFEIPVCRKLIDRYLTRVNHDPIRETIINPLDPFTFKKRLTDSVNNMGGRNVPVVIISPSVVKGRTKRELSEIGYTFNSETEKWIISDTAADFIYLKENIDDSELPGSLKIILDYHVWKKCDNRMNRYPLLNIGELRDNGEISSDCNFILIKLESLFMEDFPKLTSIPNPVFVLETDNSHAMPEMRRIFVELINNDIKIPVIIRRRYTESDSERFILNSSADTGGLFIEGLGDGLWIENESVESSKVNSACFGILQATRTRITKTEYISCPSCGRTLFNLQETTSMIRTKTNHLKGVKIAVMGCIVNGPGEMADADYGYVGSGPGKITLYKGKEIVKRNIPSENALDELIELIKENGDWIEAD